MNSEEKQLSYQITNTYSTLNDFTSKTKNIWVVFHGIGYLSRFFLKHFEELDPVENYIIAPQAQSKYYLSEAYKHIGASWLTKENTEAEIKNTMNYLDEIYKAEALKNAPNLILFGYSQGVSILSRWVAQRKINCSKIIFHSGRIPKELKPDDFEFLKASTIYFLYGNNDPFVTQEFIDAEEKRLRKLFPKKLKLIAFDGGHEVNQELILKLAE